MQPAMCAPTLYYLKTQQSLVMGIPLCLQGNAAKRVCANTLLSQNTAESCHVNTSLSDNVTAFLCAYCTPLIQ